MPLIQHRLTADGSSTFYNTELGVHYHSTHGALQESIHVFINSGLVPFLNQYNPIKIFEFGFGTGLNAWLSLQCALEHKVKIEYTSIDQYKIRSEEVSELNYPLIHKFEDSVRYFDLLHSVEWDSFFQFHSLFEIKKIHNDWLNSELHERFHLIYFDAFSPSVQPQLWDKTSVSKLYEILLPSGSLVTYCSQGQFRRNLIEAGFKVEKLPGPPGKREMLKATKN